MLNRTRSHITGNAVAYLALFVALGGTSYGLAAGSIDSREIKNNTVRTGDLRNNEVRSRDIRNRTLVGRDHLSNSLGGDQIDESELGEVPLATRAESADNALAVGGITAASLGRVAANTVDIDDGSGGNVLTLTGFGTLRATGSGCDIGGMTLLELDWVNDGQATQDVWTNEGFYDDVTGGNNSTDFSFDAYQSVRVGQQGDPDRQATIDVFVTTVDGNTECRVSAQAAISG